MSSLLTKTNIKLVKTQQKEQNESTIDTKSQLGDKSLVSWGNAPPKKEQQKVKKSQGWLQFINQKLHQWPLWVKLTADTSQQQVKPKTQIKSKQQVKAKQYQPEPFVYKQTTQLPRLIYIGRGVQVINYQYYHNKQDKLTYFYPKIERIIKTFQQITKPKQPSNNPKDRVKYMMYELDNSVLTMPTQIALPKMQQAIKNDKFSRYY